MKASCIITGGSGFIGTHLINSLLEKDKFEKIMVLDLLPPQIKNKKIDFHKIDIRRPIDLAIDQKPKILFHLAALCKEPGYPWDDYFITNYDGTKNVVIFAKRHGIQDIIFTSTMMVYRAGDKRMTEESVTAPDTAYGISKLLAEEHLQKWSSSQKNNRLRILRAGVVFGKGENGNFSNLYNALIKKYFFYIGRSSTVKSNIYVKEIVRFIEYLSKDTGNNIVYNTVFPDEITIKNICESFFDVFEFQHRILTVPYGLAIVAGYFFEMLNNIGVIKSNIHHRRIQKLFFSTNISAERMSASGFKFQYDLRKALSDWRSDCLPKDLY